MLSPDSNLFFSIRFLSGITVVVPIDRCLNVYELEFWQESSHATTRLDLYSRSLAVASPDEGCRGTKSGGSGGRQSPGGVQGQNHGGSDSKARCDTITATINSLSGHTISWAKEMRR